LACSGPATCTAVGSTINFSMIGSLGGMLLAERWNGTRWRIQPTPVLPVASDIFQPAVACPTRTSCTAVSGYESTGPGSVPLAEPWNGNSTKPQLIAAPASQRLSCRHSLADAALTRAGLGRSRACPLSG